MAAGPLWLSCLQRLLLLPGAVEDRRRNRLNRTPIACSDKYPE